MLHALVLVLFASRERCILVISCIPAFLGGQTKVSGRVEPRGVKGPKKKIGGVGLGTKDS
jgi:hypothetical protein